MSYNIIVVGPENNALVDQFHDQAFDVIQSVTNPNKGTVGQAITWVGNVNGYIQTISDPSILFVRQETTSNGVRLTLVGGFNQQTSTDQIRTAYLDALNGIITTGGTTGGNTAGGQDGGGGFGFGFGNLTLPKIMWIVAAGYSIGKYQKTKNPLFLATAGVAAINITK